MGPRGIQLRSLNTNWVPTTWHTAPRADKAKNFQKSQWIRESSPWKIWSIYKSVISVTSQNSSPLTIGLCGGLGWLSSMQLKRARQLLVCLERCQALRFVLIVCVFFLKKKETERMECSQNAKCNNQVKRNQIGIRVSVQYWTYEHKHIWITSTNIWWANSMYKE